MSNCGRHDQGEDTWGNSQDIQHKKWLYSGGGGRSSQGERMGVWVNAAKCLYTDCFAFYMFNQFMWTERPKFMCCILFCGDLPFSQSICEFETYIVIQYCNCTWARLIWMFIVNSAHSLPWNLDPANCCCAWNRWLCCLLDLWSWHTPMTYFFAWNLREHSGPHLSSLLWCKSCLDLYHLIIGGSFVRWGNWDLTLIFFYRSFKSSTWNPSHCFMYMSWSGDYW